jgi:alpha-glucosidase
MAERARSTGSSKWWWRDAVVYQIYVRSFQDSDGDGVGDLTGAIARLDHVQSLGTDAIWLSPIYPSPLADLGYDIADHAAVDPTLGTLEDFDRLVAEAHRRDLRVLLDLVPSHTSIEHPWFREHPDWYVWSDRDGPQNNWRAAFGGPAWSRDERSGRWYLHSFYPEQPDLDWRNPDVRTAIGEIVRFWLERGVDGFRVDAVERLAKDPRLRDDPPAREPFPLALHPEAARLEHRHSRGDPEIGPALASLREAAGDALLIGEVYLPTARLAPYLEHLDLAFAFELLHCAWRAPRLRETIAAAAALERAAWVLSNHDFPRVASRLGPGMERVAAMLLLTLPGAAFVYQGDEIGVGDGPGAEPPIDRANRDPHRHPMQWAADPSGGFSPADPWLAPIDPAVRNVADQERDPDSLLRLYRRLIALRRRLHGPFEPVEAAKGVLAFRRSDHVVALNISDSSQALPDTGEAVLSTAGEAATVGRELAPREGIVVRSGGS